jgi:CCR4-NOT transcription complex subunit 1
VSKVNRLERPVTKLTYKILDRWFKLTGKSINDTKLKQFKNLGYWLGRLTIARSEPVLINRLNIKDTLINSYKKKTRLGLNVEVIVKILEARKDSKIVFCIKNPWLYPILCVLRELQDKVTDNQVKTEVQRLFKIIQTEESEIMETDFLCYPVFPNEGKTSLTILELPNFVQVNEEELGHYVNEKGIDLKKIIAQSVDAAIQEIVPPVIARSVTIALVTTKQIALKDFALEPDDRKLLKGTHLKALEDINKDHTINEQIERRR